MSVLAPSSSPRALGVGNASVFMIASYDQSLKELHIANFACGLLLGAATAGISVTGAASVFPFVVVTISVVGLYHSLSRTYKVAEERVLYIRNNPMGDLSENQIDDSCLESSKEIVKKNELIKGISVAFAGFVSGFAVTLLLGHFMAAKPVVAKPAVVTQPEFHILPYPYPIANGPAITNYPSFQAWVRPPISIAPGL